MAQVVRVEKRSVAELLGIRTPHIAVELPRKVVIRTRTPSIRHVEEALDREEPRKPIVVLREEKPRNAPTVATGEYKVWFREVTKPVHQIAPGVYEAELIEWPYPTIGIFVPSPLTQESEEHGVRTVAKIGITNLAPREFRGKVVLYVEGKKVWEGEVSVPPNPRGHPYTRKEIVVPIQLPSICRKVGNETLCEHKIFTVEVELLNERGEVVSRARDEVEVFPPPPPGT